MMQQPMQGGYPLQQQAPYQQAQQPQYMPPGQGGQHAQQGPGQPGTYTGGPAPYPAPYPAAGAQPMQQPAAGMAPQPAGMQPLQQPQQQPGMAPQQPGMQAAQQAGMQGMQQAPIALPNPNMAPLKPRAPEMFKTGLYDCYSDCGVCCLGCVNGMPLSSPTQPIKHGMTAQCTHALMQSNLQTTVSPCVVSHAQHTMHSRQALPHHIRDKQQLAQHAHHAHPSVLALASVATGHLPKEHINGERSRRQSARSPFCDLNSAPPSTAEWVGSGCGAPFEAVAACLWCSWAQDVVHAVPVW